MRIACKIVMTMITMTTAEEMKTTSTMIMRITIVMMKIIIIFASSSIMQTRIKERASRLEDAEKVKQENTLD